jgi:hypothetical protein
MRRPAACWSSRSSSPARPRRSRPRRSIRAWQWALTSCWTWLCQAVAAGFTDAEHIKQDRDLDALRGREDFQKLLAELDARKK